MNSLYVNDNDLNSTPTKRKCFVQRCSNCFNRSSRVCQWNYVSGCVWKRCVMRLEAPRGKSGCTKVAARVCECGTCTYRSVGVCALADRFVTRNAVTKTRVKEYVKVTLLHISLSCETQRFPLYVTWVVTICKSARSSCEITRHILIL